MVEIAPQVGRLCMQMWTPVLLMISMVASPPARTGRAGHCGERAQTVISNSDAGRILGALDCLDLKGIIA